MFKQVLIIIILAIISLVVFSYWNFRSENQEFIYIGDVKLAVEIADEPSEQTQGLSGREKMAEDEGMLFVFPQPFIASFWMKDMRFSLDFIWLDENGVIIAITPYISPDTYPQTFQPPSPVKYVLEVNAGWSTRYNIKAGDIVSF